ncbi:hypothetical protein AJ80_03717 [Polytolypa hystricis UAMH7299]|uniref:Rhodopsin domain-containing protein n=1 Tax=Polytolypa hystricis (strain UAMH7299) TaxID=1447883 RepID=A0A2B7YHH4_POLH7|nr:hypothetical protein AJ80_03717 [Polytolypa hystricis UAMH7299]
MSSSKITDDDKSALIDILVWFLLITECLAVGTVAITKLAIRRRLGREDYLVILSLVFAIGQSVAVSRQTANGFGQRQNTLEPDQIASVLKGEYAADILLLAGICVAKLSLLAFISSITFVTAYTNAVRVLAIVVILWTISSVFVTAFQCHFPEPWNYIGNVCIDRSSFWNYYCAMNILTDIGQIVIMFVIAARMQTSVDRKATVAFVFTARIIVVAAVAGQIVYFNRTVDSLDRTFDPWPKTLATQIVQNLSIVTACIPYLKPFLESLESGVMRNDDQRRRQQLTGEYSGSYSRSKNNNNSKRSSSGLKAFKNKISSKASSSHDSNVHELNMFVPAVERKTNKATAERAEREWDDNNSQSSQARIIKETRTWTVDVRSAGPT